MDVNKKETVYFSINRNSAQAWAIHLKCPSRGIDSNYQIDASYQLIEGSENPAISILAKLGIKAKLTNLPPTGDHGFSEYDGVILNVHWPEEEEVPYLQVFLNGDKIGSTSLDPLGDPIEIFCYAALEILGFDAEIEGYE